MTIKELQTEMIEAMKQGNKIKKDVISSCIASVKKAAIDKGCRDNIDEELVNTHELTAKQLNGAAPKKVIVVPGRIVNIVM